tara:strand:+ start:789 stop:1013 length:225 start_codon:yes stop_codon:yes gene_type:complete
MSRANNKTLDSEMVTNFCEDYGYWHSDMWITAILTGQVDSNLMKQAIIAHANGSPNECQQIVDKMFADEWGEPS